jgi:hypothetical protein
LPWSAAFQEASKSWPKLVILCAEVVVTFAADVKRGHEHCQGDEAAYEACLLKQIT